MCWNRASNSSTVTFFTFNKEPPKQQPHCHHAPQLPAQGVHAPAGTIQRVRDHLCVNVPET